MILSLVGTAVVAGLLYLAWFLWTNRNVYFGTENRQRNYAHGMKGHSPPPQVLEKLRTVKMKLFDTLSNVQSSNPDIRKRKGLRILEIGAGTGANFEFYPQNTSLTVVDPNPFFEETLSENIGKHPNVKLEKCVVNDAEDMKDVLDHSVDVVVSTFVLCSVSDVQKTYKEIQRVLVPGGKYFFMDHVIDNKMSALKLLQLFLGVTRIAKFFFGGHPHIDVENEVKKAGFASVDITRFRMDMHGQGHGHGHSHGHDNKKTTLGSGGLTSVVAAPQLYGIATTV